MSTSPVTNCNRLQRSLSAEDLTEQGKALKVKFASTNSKEEAIRHLYYDPTLPQRLQELNRKEHVAITHLRVKTKLLPFDKTLKPHPLDFTCIEHKSTYDQEPWLDNEKVSHNHHFVNDFSVDCIEIENIRNVPREGYYTSQVIRQQFQLISELADREGQCPQSLIIRNIVNVDTDNFIFGYTSIDKPPPLKEFLQYTPLGKVATRVLSDLNMKAISITVDIDSWMDDDLLDVEIKLAPILPEYRTKPTH